MSEQTSQEPTMEEILASIRRIISEDEQPAEGAAPVAEPEPVAKAAEAPLPIPPPEPEPERAAAPVEDFGDDDDSDLELTQKVETHGDLDFVANDALTESAPEPEPPPPPMADPTPPSEGLVSEHVAAAAASAFGQLSSGILMPAEGRTLEDVVREMLRPMLQQWLDANLPGIVQTAVEAEVERIARGRVR
jgi:cell pole-organizing protein PopZ